MLTANDIDSFTNIMEKLLDAKIDPLKDNIETLNNCYKDLPGKVQILEKDVSELKATPEKQKKFMAWAIGITGTIITGLYYILNFLLHNNITIKRGP